MLLTMLLCHIRWKTMKTKIKIFTVVFCVSNSHYFPLMCIKMTCMFQICCQGRDNENVNELHY